MIYVPCMYIFGYTITLSTYIVNTYIYMCVMCFNRELHCTLPFDCQDRILSYPVECQDDSSRSQHQFLWEIYAGLESGFATCRKSQQGVDLRGAIVDSFWRFFDVSTVFLLKTFSHSICHPKFEWDLNDIWMTFLTTCVYFPTLFRLKKTAVQVNLALQELEAMVDESICCSPKFFSPMGPSVSIFLVKALIMLISKISGGKKANGWMSPAAGRGNPGADGADFDLRWSAWSAQCCGFLLPRWQRNWKPCPHLELHKSQRYQMFSMFSGFGVTVTWSDSKYFEVKLVEWRCRWGVLRCRPNWWLCCTSKVEMSWGLRLSENWRLLSSLLLWCSIQVNHQDFRAADAHEDFSWCRFTTCFFFFNSCHMATLGT